MLNSLYNIYIYIKMRHPTHPVPQSQMMSLYLCATSIMHECVYCVLVDSTTVHIIVFEQQLKKKMQWQCHAEW